MARAFRNQSLARMSIALLAFGALVLILTLGDLPSSTKMEVGKPASRDVKATSRVEVIDEDSTREARLRAAEQVPIIEAYNPFASNLSEEKVIETFRIVAEMARLRASTRPDPQKLKKLEDRLPLDLAPNTLATLSKAAPPALEQLQNTTFHLLRVVQKDGVREDTLGHARQRIREEADQLTFLSPDYREASVQIASKALVPNTFPDLEATKQARRAAAEKVEPSKRVVLPGEIVIREGDIVGEKDLPILEALGFYKPRLTLRGLVSYGLLAALLVALVASYARAYVPRVYQSNMLLLLLALVILTILGISRYLTTISVYLAPIATAAMLIGILLDGSLALLVTALLSMFIGIDTGSLPAAAVALMTGTVAVMAVNKVCRRWDLVKASLLVWATNILAVLVFSLLGHDGLDGIVRDTLFFGGLNGLTAALVAIGALPFLESFFGITTHIKLLELSNPSEPVLHRLLTEAPGTYQHSIMVGNLAEAAAQAIGADALLCRVGAYYHDIGKIRRPRFFVENQVGQENPHDRLAPSLSSLIIISHVKDGLELARQYRLPEILTRFIPEHHGTNLVSYFYHQARSRSTEPIFEEDFRYPGPKPQSRETAVVMLCDGIEAASRTLPSPTSEKLEELINKMVDQAVKDGHLDECDLSLKDLTNVKEALARTLASHYHGRIEYPDAAQLAPTRKAKVTRLVKNA
jgi:putative nucleotidyltransferase with HDIG domain